LPNFDSTLTRALFFEEKSIFFKEKGIKKGRGLGLGLGLN